MSIYCGAKWWWFDVEVIEECECLLPRFFVGASVCVGNEVNVGFGAVE